MVVIELTVGATRSSVRVVVEVAALAGPVLPAVSVTPLMTRRG